METTINETEYADGFNRGYWLFSYEPEVAKLLVKPTMDINDDFSVGFSEGIQQAQHDRTIDEFEQLRNKDNQYNIER